MSIWFRGWAKTQSLVALGSAESELYATLRASSETSGLMSMARDMGYHLKGHILGDASAALGIVHRKGLANWIHRFKLLMGPRSCSPTAIGVTHGIR